MGEATVFDANVYFDAGTASKYDFDLGSVARRQKECLYFIPVMSLFAIIDVGGSSSHNKLWTDCCVIDLASTTPAGRRAIAFNRLSFIKG
jgi:hypothetical protein